MKVKTIASHRANGNRVSRWCSTWSFIGVIIAATALFAPQASALSLSRGQQSLDIPYQECLRRAHAAFVAEGFDAQPSQGASFVGGFRGSSGGYITCNPVTEGKMIVNVFVASENTNDSNVPGAFRVRLQQRMESSVVSPQVAPPPQQIGAEPPRNPNYEYDVDRPGSDYRNFDLPAANPDLCAAQCAQDSRCRSFSYVSPSIQGPNARCWLKDQIPNPVRGRGGIISGVIQPAGPPVAPPKVPPGQPPITQPAPVQPPVTVPPTGQGGTWTLKEIRVFNTMDGSVATITREQYDANGGSVDIQMSGNILGFCPGGFEKIGFTWRFERSVATVTQGSTIGANLAAGQITRSQNCGTQLASRSLITLVNSSGAGSLFSAQENQLIDSERFQPGNGKRVRAAEAGNEGPGIATIWVNTYPGGPHIPNAWFSIDIGSPTKAGGGTVRIAYVYERRGG